MRLGDSHLEAIFFNLKNARKFTIDKYGFKNKASTNPVNRHLHTSTMVKESPFIYILFKKAIIDNITYILPNISSLPQSEVIFEDGNANPAYYAGLSKEMKYRWNHVFPESVYKVWEASVDRETQNITKAMYGQPYELQEVWAVVDKNLNEVGTYNSLSTVKEIFEKNKKKLNQDDNTESKEEIEKL